MCVRDFCFYTPRLRYPWGGSEVLWSQCASRLAGFGGRVEASVPDWGDLEDAAVSKLGDLGVILRRRPEARTSGNPVVRRVVRRWNPVQKGVQRWVESNAECLFVVSLPVNTSVAEPLFSIPCSPKNYVLVVQAAFEYAWPKGEHRAQLKEIYSKAKRVYFVSHHNREITECQLGIPLPQAEIIFNPFNMALSSPLPALGVSDPLKIACIARLETGVKGHDLLFRALAAPEIRKLPIEVSLYGAGPDREALEELSNMLELSSLKFCAHVRDIVGVWRSHHMGVLTSRGEGMPLSVLEGMACGRPFLVTGGTWAGELIDDGEDGFISEATVAGLRKSIQSAWVRRAKLPDMGRTAFRKISARVPSDPAGNLCERLQELATFNRRNN